MTRDAKLKSQIAATLEDLGFDVQQLEEREIEKTPDLLVETNRQRFLIEIKEKEDDPARAEREAAIAREGGMAERYEYWGPRNTVSRIAKEAAQQLTSWPEDQRDFCVLWLHAEGRDPESQWEQFRGTLLGTTNIIEMDQDSMKECFFFHDSAFYRWRDVLDGAIVSAANEAQLWVNPLSARADGLQASELARAFGHCHDPREYEERGEAYIADCEIDRKDTGAVKLYLQEKYKTAPMDHMHVGRMTVIAFFDESDDPSQEVKRGQRP